MVCTIKSEVWSFMIEIKCNEVCSVNLFWLILTFVLDSEKEESGGGCWDLELLIGDEAVFTWSSLFNSFCMWICNLLDSSIFSLTVIMIILVMFDYLEVPSERKGYRCITFLKLTITVNTYWGWNLRIDQELIVGHP